MNYGLLLKCQGFYLHFAQHPNSFENGVIFLCANKQQVENEQRIFVTFVIFLMPLQVFILYLNLLLLTWVELLSELTSL